MDFRFAVFNISIYLVEEVTKLSGGEREGGQGVEEGQHGQDTGRASP